LTALNCLDLHYEELLMAISPFVLALVATGGACGALLRFGCAVAVEYYAAKTSFSFATVVVNIVGCFAAGFLLARFGGTLEGIDPHVKALVFTGLLGGFTTFSAFGVDVLQLVHAGHILSACISIALNVCGSLLAVGIGFKLAGLC
jgi:CrcB protein